MYTKKYDSTERFSIGHMIFIVITIEEVGHPENRLIEPVGFFKVIKFKFKCALCGPQSYATELVRSSHEHNCFVEYYCN